jgi:hypothetical protein
VRAHVKTAPGMPDAVRHHSAGMALPEGPGPAVLDVDGGAVSIDKGAIYSGFVIMRD